MAHFRDWMKNTFTAQVVTFASGLLASVVIRAIFGEIVPLTEGVIDLLIIFLIVLATAVLVGLRHDVISSLIQSKLSAKVYHSTKTLNGDVPLYDPIIQVISSAKESIRVIGLYRPLSLETTPGRIRYYEKINELLETKHRRGERFRYERILQVKDVKPGTLNAQQVDGITYRHCTHLLGLQNQRTALTIHLRQIPDILGSLSFVIVDEKEIVFAVPAVTRTEMSQLKALQLGTGIVFSDNEGSLVKEMLNLFDDIRLRADEILILDPTG
jgi:hypothetical protein